MSTSFVLHALQGLDVPHELPACAMIMKMTCSLSPSTDHRPAALVRLAAHPLVVRVSVLGQAAAVHRGQREAARQRHQPQLRQEGAGQGDSAGAWGRDICNIYLGRTYRMIIERMRNKFHLDCV